MIQDLIGCYEVRRVTLSTAQRTFSQQIDTERKGVLGEIDAFLALAQIAKVPLELIHHRPGENDSMPLSLHGKTVISYVGETPLVQVEPDRNGNLRLIFAGRGAVEVIFNSKSGSNFFYRRPQTKKKIYIVE